MDVPDDVCDQIERAVTACLARELDARGLLLSSARAAAADAQARVDGERLLVLSIHRCYPLSEHDTQVLTLEFDSEHQASRVRSALAFGAATARLLMPPLQPQEHADSIALLSAIFNLGIGLIDGVCDSDTDTGSRMLELIAVGDVADAARRPRPRGWLRVQLPPQLETDPSVSFAVDIVETFFAMLHATYPDEPWFQLRARVGDQLAAALDAERASLVAPFAGGSHTQLTRYSYTTSVLPFEIMGTLAQGDHASAAARLLGEAVWRIDDLVDLCDDARTGALNAILLAATSSDGQALAQLLTSDHIGRAAAHAGDHLRRGIERADGHDGTRSADVFLHFMARYAGITPPGSL